MLVPAALVTTPVGAKSPEWVKTIKPAMLQDAQLKTFDQRRTPALASVEAAAAPNAAR